MIVDVFHHIALETTIRLFADHEDGENEMLVEDDHGNKLVKFVADKYFTLRLFDFGKKNTLRKLHPKANKVTDTV